VEALRILLKGEGHQTEAVTSISGIFNALQQRDYALLMMDLNYTRDTTSGQEGLEVIPKIQALDSTLPIVVMTAWATIDLAVEAMKLGARDFVPCSVPGNFSFRDRISGARITTPIAT
jgi:DNA-binding NtrC family response regulator